MAMDGSFTIFYIVGDATRAPGTSYTALPGFVGITHIFTAPRELCSDCDRQEDENVRVSNTTPITSQFLGYIVRSDLNSMEPEDVQPFLVKNLKWRIGTVCNQSYCYCPGQKSAQADFHTLQIDGSIADPCDLARDGALKLSVSCKTAPLPGQEGSVKYDVYQDVIDEIIEHASER